MKKKAIIILGVLMLACVVSFANYSYIKVKQWDSLILPKVKIENEDLTGKTRQQAQTIMKDKYSSKVIKKKITIVTDEKKYTVDYAMLDAKYNIDEAVNQAMSYGSDMNMFQKYKAIRKPVNKNIKLTFEYNDKIIDTILAEMAKDTNKESVNATITKVENGEFIVTNDTIGKQLESDKLKKEIKSKINGILSEDVISIKAQVKDLKPKVTAKALKTINTKISNYNTNFSSSKEGRITNIDLSTKSINGTLLMPGDVFSFNGVVGERTVARGYQTAGVIIGDKLEQGLGGGICQTSSTLYNAILSTGIVSVERIHHTISSGYIPKGQDATVDYGNLDYKFKNTFKYPIYIEGSSLNGNLNFNVYSNSELTKKTYRILNEVNGVTQPTTQIIQDPTMYEGQKEIVKTGYAGFKVKISRQTYENGKLVKTEVISNDTFHVINGITKVGTKK
ncbi:VanW family protein [Clostridium lacusfryxellense]|uniref:VanW family protein n=1 Tax=Clostridium lacusfryxellense TaxID=205328 RepID=UPI001C0AD098|nr:VanW family protein [Clostridium lacusfryxellense]MBU3112819.1 VanW family protein [Clostridium lacusfryxellense]